MKMPIAWHEECHKNASETLRRDREALERHMEQVERTRLDVTAYGQQIAEAKRRGVDGFDRERFMQSKRNRCA